MGLTITDFKRSPDAQLKPCWIAADGECNSSTYTAGYRWLATSPGQVHCPLGKREPDNVERSPDAQVKPCWIAPDSERVWLQRHALLTCTRVRPSSLPIEQAWGGRSGEALLDCSWWWVLVQLYEDTANLQPPQARSTVLWSSVSRMRSWNRAESPLMMSRPDPLVVLNTDITFVRPGSLPSIQARLHQATASRPEIHDRRHPETARVPPGEGAAGRGQILPVPTLLWRNYGVQSSQDDGGARCCVWWVFLYVASLTPVKKASRWNLLVLTDRF